jgi:hypothetical protein
MPLRSLLGLVVAIVSLPATVTAEEAAASAMAGGTGAPATGPASPTTGTVATTSSTTPAPTSTAPALTSVAPKTTAVAQAEPALSTKSTIANEADKPPVATKPPPYSLPWQLRPVTVGNVVRSDTSVAFFRATNPMTGETEPGTTVSSMLLATLKVTPKLAPLARLAFVYNNEPGIPDAAPSSAAVMNPLIGTTYAETVAGLKVAAFGAVTLPIGQGGGDSPDAGDAKAAARGIPARAAMDNAMFATNFFALIGGVGAAYVKHGFTGQAEVTVLQLFKTRGPDMEDARRTNFTAGVHAGYFVSPLLSFGGELRYQRWLTDAAPVVKNPDARETVTFAIGPRLHLKLDGKQWIRPGISYSRVIDAPWSKDSYQMVQVDVPFVF